MVSRKKVLHVQRLRGRETMLREELKVVPSGCDFEWGVATGIAHGAIEVLKQRNGMFGFAFYKDLQLQ